MRFISIRRNGIHGLGLADGTELEPTHARVCWANEPGYPGSLDDLVSMGSESLRAAADSLAAAPEAPLVGVEFMPALQRPGKIVCIGLNYVDHSIESGFEPPLYPTVFSRYASSLIGHGAPIVRPRVSEQLDYEGELAVVIGKRASHVSQEDALSHVLGYAVFNDGSVRDYQFKSAQWTLGKNFDHSGGFGPMLVTADELPPGASGLRLETRLNGRVVQSATTADMIFDVAALISLMSAVHALEPGDVIVSGTPAGVGVAHKPPLWMKAGDVCEVEIERIGLLRNPVIEDR